MDISRSRPIPAAVSLREVARAFRWPDRTLKLSSRNLLRTWGVVCSAALAEGLLRTIKGIYHTAVETPAPVALTYTLQNT